MTTTAEKKQPLAPENLLKTAHNLSELSTFIRELEIDKYAEDGRIRKHHPTWNIKYMNEALGDDK
jgi:hypothetical protein